MSVLYSTIAFAAAVAAYRPGVDHSMRAGSTADRLFGVLNAVGETCSGLALHLESPRFCRAPI